MKAGLFEGRGVYRYADGKDLYEGEWKAGKREGGVYMWANGDVYEGEYKADEKEGRGIYRYPNGDVESRGD